MILASYPYITVRKDGSFGVCWFETNSTIGNTSRLKFRLFNNSGAPLNNEIILVDNSIAVTISPYISIDCDTTGKFVIALQYNSDIFYQRIDKYGNKTGNAVKINDDTGSHGQGYPNLSVKQDGSFIVCWQDGRPQCRIGLHRIFLCRCMTAVPQKLGITAE